jgi:tetratricopeptide (TPR) repeat protein
VAAERPDDAARAAGAGLVAAALLVLLPAASPAAQEDGGHEHDRGGHAHAGRAADAAAGDAVPPDSLPPLRDDLGDHHHPVSTEAADAQAYFDQGLRLAYAFQHDEAVRSFRAATRLDPGCAMCWWGVAWASGPNINAAMDSAGGARAHGAIRTALGHLDDATDRERAYVRAMAERYGPDPAAERAARDSAYARAMRDVADRWPSDDDAQVLAAESIMLLSPWDYWTEPGGEAPEPKPGTEELLRRLRTVAHRNPRHAGACHFYIHAVEAAHPERALPCAGRIADLMPGAGHVVHMPAHVYIRVGRYADAVEANLRAIRADEAQDVDERGRTVYTLAYHPHNYHFLSYAASMAGRREVALRAARTLAEKVDREMMREPGFAALQHYLVTPLRVMVRFGTWEEILEEPAPPDDLLYPLGTWRYARAMAHARTGRPDEAERELAALREIRADPSLEEQKVWDLNATADLLGVAVKVVEGEVAAARGDHGEAVDVLEEGVRREARLVYDEPPPWHLPVRHVLGAVLLEAGRPAEAERVYREALERFPENGWCLYGLAESLEAQGRTDEARDVRERLAEAWRSADVELEGSRF